MLAMPAMAAGTGAAVASEQRALPRCFEFNAPAEWRTIDFISDLHLSEQMPATFEAWRRHLLRTPAQAVFILGDLFELWVGDDARDGAFARQCLAVLAEAASLRVIGVMCGNRDFLLGAEFLRATGALGLPDPTVLGAWGQRIVLSHGDALCLADVEYQGFRAQVRSAAWQEQFLAKPLAERLTIARSLREASSARRRFDGDAASGVDEGEAAHWLEHQRATTMVHGHTHRPASVALADGCMRHVLSDWDLDTPVRPRAEILRLTRDGFARVAPVA